MSANLQHLQARRKLSKRPWRVDDFDDFLDRAYNSNSNNHRVQQHLSGQTAAAAAINASIQHQHLQQQLQGLTLQEQQQHQQQPSQPVPVRDVATAAGCSAADGSSDNSGTNALLLPPFRRVMVFVDNAGADIVLGMLPFVRELLRLRCEVVMVANSLPAINDITAAELRSLLSAAAEVCPIIKAARTAALAHEAPGRSTGLAGGPTIPPYPGLRQRQSSAHDLLALAAAASAGGNGVQSPTTPSAAAGGATGAGFSGIGTLGGFGSPLSSIGGGVSGLTGAVNHASLAAEGAPDLALLQRLQHEYDRQQSSGSSSNGSNGESGSYSGAATAAAVVSAAGTAASADSVVEPKLFVLGNGSGSPCLDLSRVPAALADATVGVDLLVRRSVFTSSASSIWHLVYFCIWCTGYILQLPCWPCEVCKGGGGTAVLEG